MARINRETHLQETPISITCATAENIERTGSQRLEDLQTFASNMAITNDGDFAVYGMKLLYERCATSVVGQHFHLAPDAKDRPPVA